LTYSLGGYTHYLVTFTVRSEDEKNGFGQFIRRLLRRRRSSGQVATSYEYYGDKRDENFVQTLTLEGPRPRNYCLRVEVEDLNTGESVYKESVFHLRKSNIE